MAPNGTCNRHIHPELLRFHPDVPGSSIQVYARLRPVESKARPTESNVRVFESSARTSLVGTCDGRNRRRQCCAKRAGEAESNGRPIL
eukprot:scaffold358_cov343-Pavlova_lutheri.AAC.53